MFLMKCWNFTTWGRKIRSVIPARYSNNRHLVLFVVIYQAVLSYPFHSSASLALVRGIHRRPVNSPHKWPVTRKMFPFDDVIMSSPSLKCWHISVLMHCIAYQLIYSANGSNFRWAVWCSQMPFISLINRDFSKHISVLWHNLIICCHLPDRMWHAISTLHDTITSEDLFNLNPLFVPGVT